jgi:photosystem II stability/assembly factor-like uncharacterized protein
MNTTRRYAVFLLGFLGALFMLLAAGISVAQQFNENLFKGMKWRSIGPFRGGRVLAVAGVPSDPSTYYFGGVAGGVWKTVDGGVNWTPLFDKEPVSSIGSIAVAPSDPNVIYAGTGEACIRGNISFGDGVYKSLDGGKTWKNVGLRDTRHIGAVIVHPRNPEIVLVAALGHAYGPNPERGIFRSTNGGNTWEKVLYKDEKTGGIDLTFDPSNPHILFAALWETYRTPYSLSSGGPGSGLYKSGDGGTTWKRLEGNGLPKGILGRIGVSISGADPNRVYALIEAEEGGLYRSDDGGEKWTRVNEDRRFLQRAWYYMHIYADPKNVDTVYVLNTGMFRSTDGGKGFNLIPAPHGDHHGLWINPLNPQCMINGNDGGANITVDGGKSWTRQDNQPTAQFYHVIADTRFPYYVYGAQQDNTTVGIASRSDEAAIGRQDWSDVGGGESGYIAPDPRDPNIVYAGSSGGYITRLDKRTGQRQSISPWPEDTSGQGAADLPHRFQWTEPILFSPHDPNVLYTAAERLFRTSNQGSSWTAISPDLTRNDKSKQQSSGGPLTKDNTGVEYYDTIFTVAESPLQKGLIWVGTDDGLIHLTRDGGANWTNITPKEMPEWSMVSVIEASAQDPGTAYAAVDRHKLDDYRPYIYVTRDYGKTWKKTTNGLPDTAYVHAVREDPVKKGLLYAGTETGMFVSFDDGARWQPLQLNLPQSPIHDLVVKDDDLIVATHGRSFWILDDLTPLRQLSETMASADVYLYKPRLTYRLHGPGGFGSRRGPVGENPPNGAIICYYLKSAPKEKEEVTLEILDHQGKLVRKFSNLKKEREEGEPPPEWPEMEKPQEILPAEAGMNRFVWDMRYEPPPKAAGAAFTDFQPQGPLALPGSYQAKFNAGGKSFTVPLELKLDPRVKVAETDLEKQFELAMKICQRVSQDHTAVNLIRDLRAQLKALRKRVTDSLHGKEIIATADDLDKKMTQVEGELVQTKAKASEDTLNFPVKLNDKLVTLAGMMGDADAAPAQQDYEVFDVLSRQLDAQLAQWKQIQSKELTALNDLMRKDNIPVVGLTPPAKASGESAP